LNAAARVLERCDRLAQISEEERRLVRRFGTDAMRRANGLVGGWMPDAERTTHERPANHRLPYGGTCFASIVGQLAGNHFLTVTDGREQLRELGRLVLWEGAQDVRFERP
jgi:hypothetical protein